MNGRVLNSSRHDPGETKDCPDPCAPALVC